MAPPQLKKPRTTKKAATAPSPPSPPTHYFKIQGVTGDPIKISAEALRHMKTLHTMAENMGITVDSAKEMDWCEHHKDKGPKSEEELAKVNSMPEWDRGFLDRLNKEELVEMVKAMDYLDVGFLSSYVYVLVAKMADGKSAVQIMLMFGIPEKNEKDEYGAFFKKKFSRFFLISLSSINLISKK